MRRRRNEPLRTLIRSVTRLVDSSTGGARTLRNDVLRDWQRVMADAALFLRALETQRARGGVWLQAFPRAWRMIAAAGRILTGYRMARWTGVTDLTPVHQRAADEIYRLAEDLGGAIIKLAQFLSCRPDLLPAPFIETLAPLCFRAPAVPFAAIEAVLGEELGDQAAHFASIDPEPIGTGSLAQVHRATLLGGREVAVKVQLPGVAEIIATDLLLLEQLASWFAPEVPGANLPQIIGELGRSIRAELDFAAEAEHAERFARLYRDHPSITVPEVLSEHSTGRVLCLTFAPGTPLVRYLPEAPPVERRVVLERWLGSVLEQVFVYGLVHTDPHAGNFLVDGERLVLLDFGSVLELPEHVRKGYVAIVRALVAGNEQALCQALGALGFAAENGTETLAAVARELLGGVRDPARLAALRADPTAMVETLLVRLREAGKVEIPDHFVLIGRVLGALAGQILRYGAGVDVTSAFVKTLARA